MISHVLVISHALDEDFIYNISLSFLYSKTFTAWITIMSSFLIYRSTLKIWYVAYMSSLNVSGFADSLKKLVMCIYRQKLRGQRRLSWTSSKGIFVKIKLLEDDKIH